MPPGDGDLVYRPSGMALAVIGICLLGWGALIWLCL